MKYSWNIEKDNESNVNVVEEEDSQHKCLLSVKPKQPKSLMSSFSHYVETLFSLHFVVHTSCVCVGGLVEGSGCLLLSCVLGHVTSMDGRGRQGASSRATAEFGLSLEFCTSAGDNSYTHIHILHAVSVSRSSRVCVCAWVGMCAFVGKNKSKCFSPLCFLDDSLLLEEKKVILCFHIF